MYTYTVENTSLTPSIRVSQSTASSLGQLLDDLILARKIVGPVSV